MKALIWLGGREKRDQSRVNVANPGLAPSQSSGGSRAANADGAPRKHGAFHSRGLPNRKAPAGDYPIAPSFGNASAAAATSARPSAEASSIRRISAST